MHNFLKSYKIRQEKGKRSVAGGFIKIGKLLLSAANSVESSVLLGVVESVTRNLLSLLENFNSKIQTSGLNSRVIKAQPSTLETVNIERFLEAAETYQENFDELSKIRMNANIFIEQLLSTNTQLQKYYRFLVENEQPTKNATAEFLKDQNYIFSVYVRQNKIVRQFVRTEDSHFKSKITTLIPLHKNLFFEKKFWTQESFLGKKFAKSNQCMIHLLKDAFSKQTAKICEDHVETRNWHKIQRNVFVVEQRFG